MIVSNPDSLGSLGVPSKPGDLFETYLLEKIENIVNNLLLLGGSPGLVVMGGDSCSEGRGFKSRHCILDGHLFYVNFVMMFV